jgi:hypothetical protein
VRRHIVVAGRERLQISPELVADVAIGRDAVGFDNDEIDHAVLHRLAGHAQKAYRLQRNAALKAFIDGWIEGTKTSLRQDLRGPVQLAMT